MCFCDGNNEEMKKSVEDMKVKIETLAGTVKSEKAEKAQLEQDLVKCYVERTQRSYKHNENNPTFNVHNHMFCV